jgi:hypothetical protein
MKNSCNNMMHPRNPLASYRTARCIFVCGARIVGFCVTCQNVSGLLFVFRHGLIDPTGVCRCPLIEIGHSPWRRKSRRHGYLYETVQNALRVRVLGLLDFAIYIDLVHRGS